MKDISHEDDGLYQCTVANHVGYSVCVVEVKVSGKCSGLGGPVAGLEESRLCFAHPLHVCRFLLRAGGRPWEKHANIRG